MRATFVGTGDAFCTGGRAHACIRLENAGGGCIALDFGASSLLQWKALGFDSARLDAVIVSHLHGDHFGGLPFLLLDAQYSAGRVEPLAIIGPPGLRQRLDTLLETMYPGSTATRWNFEWRAVETLPGGSVDVAGFTVSSFLVDHPAGAAATALRVEADGRVFAFSGDTSWTPALTEAARGADVFACECFAARGPAHGHLDWADLKTRLSGVAAKQIVLLHLGREAMALQDEMRAAGVTIADDGMTIAL